MEQNSVVIMLDEEIARLQQVRTILESLVVVEAGVAPLVQATEEEPAQQPEKQPAEAAKPPVIRHVSRRGISTGRRGPRRVAEVAVPRPLDAAVPKAPVVVSRSALVASKPVKAPAPPVAADGTLEHWVRSLKKNSPVA